MCLIVPGVCCRGHSLLRSRVWQPDFRKPPGPPLVPTAKFRHRRKFPSVIAGCSPSRYRPTRGVTMFGIAQTRTPATRSGKQAPANSSETTPHPARGRKLAAANAANPPRVRRSILRRARLVQCQRRENEALADQSGHRSRSLARSPPCQ